MGGLVPIITVNDIVYLFQRDLHGGCWTWASQLGRQSDFVELVTMIR